ncbi:MAG: ABC transporter permease [Candidatus Asgardarchaeia archaeon]
MIQVIFKNLVRRPRHTLSIAFGVIIAVSLISGLFIASTNISALALQKHLEDVPFDFIGVQPSMHNYEFAVNHLKSVEYVNDVNIFGHMNIAGEINKTPQEPLEVQREYIHIVGADKDVFNKVSSIIIRNGTFDLTHGAGVSSLFAEKYNLTIGDDFYLSSNWAAYNIKNDTIEFKVTIAKFHLAFIFELNDTLKEYADKIGVLGEFILINSSYQYEIYNDFINKPLHLIPGYAITLYFIFLEREKIINPFDLQGTLDRLRTVNETLYYTGLIYGIQIYDILSPAIEELMTWANYNLYVFGVFSLPLIVVSILTTVSATNIMVDDRRREIGLLKIRGASSAQILKMLLIESIVIGIFASIISYFVSWGLGYFLTYVMSAYWKQTAVNIPLIPKLSPAFMLLLLGLGIGITIFATYSPISKISKLNLRNFVAEYVEYDEHEERISKWTLLWLMLGTYKVTSWVLGFELTQFEVTGGSFLQTVFWYNLVFLDSYVLQYIGPLLFIYALSKIITLRLDIFSKPLRLALHPIFKKLDLLIMSSISRKTARYVRVAFIIALTISFAITASIMSTSELNYHFRVAKTELGSDINLKIYPSAYKIIDNISTIDGVEAVTFIGRWRVYFIFRRVSLYIINAEDYINVTNGFMDPNFVRIPTYEKAMAALATPNERKYIGNAMVNTKFSKLFNKEIGTYFVLMSRYGFINGSVVGIYDLFAGVEDYIGDVKDELSAIMDYDYIKTLKTGRSSTITPAVFDDLFVLVKVKEGYSISDVKKEILNRFSNKIIKIDTIEERMNEILSDPRISSTYNFLRLEVIFTTLIATVGVAYVTIVSILERKREFGVLFARGMDKDDLVKMILGEFLVILFVAYILGAIAGYATGVGYAYFFGKVAEAIIPYTVTVTDEPIYILLVSFVSFVITVYIPAHLLSKVNVRESLHAL